MNATSETMIRLDSSDYFHPTKEFRQLAILLALHKEPDIRQQAIAQEANMSGAMVNAYIKQFKAGGLIDVHPKNRRDLQYSLTAEGREKLMYHLLECSAEIVRLYTQAKKEILSRFQQVIPGSGTLRVVVYGGSATGRLVLEVLEEFSHLKVSAVVDSDPEKWGQSSGLHIVQGPEILSMLEVDLIIIASFARQNEIFETLLEKNFSAVNILKLSSL